MQGGLVDEDRRQGGGILKAGDGVTDLDVFNTDHRTDVPRFGGLDLLAAQPLEEVQFLNTGLARFCVGAEDLNLFMLGELAGGDATDGDATDELGVVECADPQLKRGIQRHRWGGDVFDDGIEDLLQIVSFTTQFFFAPAVTA